MTSSDGTARPGGPVLDREGLLAIFLEKAPTARSPYGLYGYPPMWAIATRGGETLFARPGRTLTRVNFQYVEVEGVHWQLRRGDAWVGQGYQAETTDFLKHLEAWRTPGPDPRSEAEGPLGMDGP